MVEKLAKLYNTLSLIETKGENTKLLAQCLVYLENMIGEASASQSDQVAETTE